MKEKQMILLKYFHEWKSMRKISRESGLSRPTVAKYVNAYKEAKVKLEQSGSELTENLIIHEMLEKPKYKKPTRSKRKLTREITDRIDELLEINNKRRSQKQFKQILKKQDIHQILKSENYNIGYTTVCNYVNNKVSKSEETFIKQEYQPGSICEFDWADVKLNIGGVQRTYQLALFTSAYSNFYFAKLYAYQNTQCFQESHSDFFKKTDCVFDTMVYDNMRVAVKKFVGRSEKEATEGLLKLSMFYLFNYRFCNVRKGNEKGHVERGVEFVRRKTFAYNDTFSDILEANKTLEITCDKLNNELRSGRVKSGYELFQEEKEVLPKSPGTFSCAEKVTCKVDKYSTITQGTCHYSVPEEYNGKLVDLLIFSNKIVIYDNLQFLCEHTRKHGHSEWSLDLNHYLKTLFKKPKALKGSLALSQSEKLIQSIFTKHFLQKPKEFVELLLYLKENKKDIAKIKEIIDELEVIKPDNKVTLDQIKMLDNQVLDIQDKKSMSKIEQHSLSQISKVMGIFYKQEEEFSKSDNSVKVK